MQLIPLGKGIFGTDEEMVFLTNTIVVDLLRMVGTVMEHRWQY